MVGFLGLVEQVEFVNDHIGVFVGVVSWLAELGVGVWEWPHGVSFVFVFCEFCCVLFEFCSRSIAFFFFSRFGEFCRVFFDVLVVDGFDGDVRLLDRFGWMLGCRIGGVMQPRGGVC